jgi:hypothetical protein
VLADRRGQERLAPLAAPDHHLEAELAVAVAAERQADVVRPRGGAVLGGRGDSDLELARQPVELRVHRRPLPDGLRPDAGIVDLLGRRAGEGVAGDVANAVAAGLDGVQVDLGQRVEDVGGVGQLDPVELDVLARGEVAVVPVPAPSDVGQPAQLYAGQRAVGNGDPQHVGVQLQVQAVAQAERLELVLGQLTGEAAGDLGAELVGALAYDGGVDGVVGVNRGWHGTPLTCA